jgi:hypothetical protein
MASLDDIFATDEMFASAGVTIDDFYAVMPMHAYIYAPTRELWPASSVNSRLPPFPIDNGKKSIPANIWLDQNRPVEQLTWAPGLPMIVNNRLIADGGWINREGVRCFNQYRPPIVELGDPTQATLWVDHVKYVYGENAGHIISWLAFRVQRPEVKINHCLVLGGNQGIGKDTLLAPLKYAVGPWNFIEVSPHQMLGRFNSYLRSVILRISEARDLGDTNRFQFYDRMKSYIASPPEVLRVDEKHIHEYSIQNGCGVVMTTNHKADGIYLPADDRRHHVSWSERTKDDFTAEYWNKLWSFYDNGGNRHVAAYLTELVLDEFDPKAPPPKTQAFWDIVDASRPPEDAELADVLDRLGNPDATTLIRVTNEAAGGFRTWIEDRKNRRVIPHRMEQVGYVPIRNDTTKSGLWKINGTRQVVYAKATLPVRARFAAARQLMALGQPDAPTDEDEA